MNKSVVPKVYVTNAIDGDVLELLDNGKQYGGGVQMVQKVTV